MSTTFIDHYWIVFDINLNIIRAPWAPNTSITQKLEKVMVVVIEQLITSINT